MNGDQLYPEYLDFQKAVRKRFWKDMDAQIKHTQWEKLKQLSYPNGDLFFQKFKELAFEARVLKNEQMMLSQIKKAAHETSKNTIFSANSNIPTTYPEWKSVFFEWTITTISRKPKA